jgi:CubicO group peptidase (beta-lactamase class C family)
VNEQLEKDRVKQKIVGMSVVIVHDQNVILAKSYGYADLESKRPADIHTVYRVGSITKVFTALMLMQLRDVGKLQLDDPIEKYLPEFKIKSRFPDARPITFRQVASHYAGLPTEAPLPYTYQRVTVFPRTEDLIGSLAHSELQVPPMTSFIYSNLGFNILGLALERIAQERYAAYVTKRILKPLGMSRSGFALTDRLKESLATGYKAADKNGAHAVAPYVAYGEASGMLYASATDLAEVLKLHCREGPVGGKQVLGSSALREMTAPVFVSDDDPVRFWRYGSGIGWQIVTTSGFQFNHKSGGTIGFSAEIIFNPHHKLGIVICTNTECSPFMTALMPLLRLAPLVKRQNEEKQAEAARAAVAVLRKYAGTYRLRSGTDPKPPFEQIVLGVTDTRLRMSIPKVTMPDVFITMNEVTVQPAGRNAFRILSDTFEHDFLYFEENEKGEIACLRWRTYIFEKGR